MMDYSKMSDFEVNAAVFEALHGGAPDYKEGDSGAMVLISYEGDIVGGDAVEVEVESGAFNPCSSPADAWPIIVENKIMLSPRCAAEQWKAQIHLGNEDIFDNYASAWHANPLRAAMIVFLMMRESN